MEAVYSKIKDMLKAFYPVLYLTSFEYDRTKQKIEGIINVLRSEGKDVRIFNWNCVDGLRGLNGDKPQPVINKDGEEIVEPEEVLKYILNDKDVSKDVFVLEDFNNYIEEENVKYFDITLGGMINSSSCLFGIKASDGAASKLVFTLEAREKTVEPDKIQLGENTIEILINLFYNISNYE